MQINFWLSFLFVIGYQDLIKSSFNKLLIKEKCFRPLQLSYLYDTNHLKDPIKFIYYYYDYVKEVLQLQCNEYLVILI